MFVLDHDCRVTPFKDNRPGKTGFLTLMVGWNVKVAASVGMLFVPDMM